MAPQSVTVILNPISLTLQTTSKRMYKAVGKETESQASKILNCLRITKYKPNVGDKILNLR